MPDSSQALHPSPTQAALLASLQAASDSHAPHAAHTAGPAESSGHATIQQLKGGAGDGGRGRGRGRGGGRGSATQAYPQAHSTQPGSQQEEAGERVPEAGQKTLEAGQQLGGEAWEVHSLATLRALSYQGFHHDCVAQLMQASLSLRAFNCLCPVLASASRCQQQQQGRYHQQNHLCCRVWYGSVYLWSVEPMQPFHAGVVQSSLHLYTATSSG